jgi:Heterokaryon incompatibility protein (HET)
MRKVYENGTQTLIWLGLDDYGQAELACNVIRRLGLSTLRVAGVEPESLAGENDMWNVAEQATIDALQLSELDIIAISHFFDHEWFKRLWVSCFG